MGWLPPWFGAQPERLAQDTAYLPFGSPGTPRRPGRGGDLSRLVALPGLRKYLTAPVIGKLAGLIWVHVIHLFPPPGNGLAARLTAADSPPRQNRLRPGSYLPIVSSPPLMTPYDLCRTLSA
jgi:hypothetical protein